MSTRHDLRNAGSKAKTCRVYRVVLRDAHPISMYGLGMSLNQSGAFQVCAEVLKVRDVSRTLTETGAELLICDNPTHDFGNGATRLIEGIVKSHPRVVVVALFGCPTSVEVGQARQAGAQGCLSKEDSLPTLFDQLLRIMNGETIFPKLLNEQSSISPRLQEVLSGVRKGLSNKEIGSLMGLSESSVGIYTNRLYKKINARNRAQAVTLTQEFETLDLRTARSGKG